MNIFAKSLLVLTSLSPVSLVVGVSKFERGEPWLSWIWWLAAVPALVAVCRGMLRYAAKKCQKAPVHVKEFERKDQEVLTFLFIYLLPFIQSGSSTIANEPMTSICILVIITIALARAGAFHFNPVMSLIFRYRFYAIRNVHGVPNLLISREVLRRTDIIVPTVKVADNVYLQREDVDA